MLTRISGPSRKLSYRISGFIGASVSEVIRAFLLIG
jgi:hypothetical protein